MKPALTVILPALLGVRTVEAAIKAWEGQTCSERIEMMILCPDTELASQLLDPSWVKVCTKSSLLHQARAKAVQLASADTVMFAEDHCLPNSHVAERMLARVAEGWEVVGPSLQAGAETPAGGASFLIGYGQWMPPVQSGPIADLPGHNVVVSRKILTDQGECLSDRLFVQGMFFQQLRKQGRNYFLESEARMVHYDPPKLSKNLPIFVVNGLSVGAVRAEDWWWPLRSAYAFAFPFVATAHWIRAFRQQMRIGASISQSLKRLIAAIPLAFAWGMGESAGAVLGRRRVEGLSWRSEVKPVSIESVAAFESASQIHSLPAKAVPTLSPTEN